MEEERKEIGEITGNTEQKTVCANCGGELSHGQKFCDKCGAKVENTVQFEDTAKVSEDALKPDNFKKEEKHGEENKRKKLSKGAIIGIICAAVAAAVIICLALSGIFGGSGAPGGSRILPTSYYFVSDGGESMAYLKNGEITEFDAPKGITAVRSLTQYGEEECIVLAEDGMILVSSDGSQENILSEYSEIIDVNKYGIIYVTEDGFVNFKPYRSDVQKLAEFNGIENVVSAVSPSGDQIVVYLENEEKFFLTKETEGKTEFDADILKDSSLDRIFVFNNGAFYYTAENEDGITLYFTDGNKTDEIGDFECTESKYVTQWAHFNSDGSKALIQFDDVLMLADNKGGVIFISDEAQDGEIGMSWIELPNNLDGGMELCDGSDIRLELDFDSFYYGVNDELYYYADQKSQFVADSPSWCFYVFGNEIIYVDNDGALCKGSYKNNKFNSEKIEDDVHTFLLGENGNAGYFINGDEDTVYYLSNINNGTAERVTKDFDGSVYRISLSGKCFAAVSDGTLILYKDGEKYETISKNEAEQIYSNYGEGYFGSPYIKEDEIIYSTDKNSLVKWTADGKETLLKNIVEYSDFADDFVKSANAAASGEIWNGSEFTVTTTQFGDAFGEYLESLGTVSIPGDRDAAISLFQFDKTESAYGILFDGDSRDGNIYLIFRTGTENEEAEPGGDFSSIMIGTNELVTNTGVWLDAMYVSARLMCFLSPEEYPSEIVAFTKISDVLQKAQDNGQLLFSDSWTVDGLEYEVLMDFGDDGMYGFTANAK